MGGIYEGELSCYDAVYITISVKIGSGIQKFLKEDIQTNRQTGDRISPL
jgi:hypothetical protein